LFGWHSIDSFRPWPHEFDATAGDDEGLEAVGAEVGQHFEHRLIDHLRVKPAGLRMLSGGDPVADNFFKLIAGHACMGGHGHFNQGLFPACEGGFHVAFENGGERFLLLPLGMLRRKRLDAVEDEEGLEIHRLFRPQRAVVVEDGDAFGGRNQVGSLGGYFRDEGDDRLLRRGVVPRRQRILSMLE